MEEKEEVAIVVAERVKGYPVDSGSADVVDEGNKVLWRNPRKEQGCKRCPSKVTAGNREMEL